ncbi:ABC transporter ATP-binding protein/permease [Frankia sp. Cpl3]|uniref:ABC transporter ATP-binding protein n=1 Tax=Parafrankia colletiae TaxID=573497 RepID=UPI0009FC0C87|nr:ABC transporter ATP-binding protein [Parafrankia colletiae]MCK9902492.1 ABC transporter ATP-binding protein/permease [Frankia sp. Cpl3]
MPRTEHDAASPRPGRRDGRQARPPRGDGLLGRTLVVLRPRWPAVALAALLLVTTTAAALAGPWILRYAVDEGLVGDRPDTGVITRAGALYLGVAVAGLVLARLQVELVGRIGEWFVRELRGRAVDHIMAMSVRYFDRTPAGVLVSRLTADVDALQDAVQLGVVPFAQAVLTLVFLAAVLVALSWELALVCVLPALGLFAATVWFRRTSRAAFAAVRDRVSDTVSALTERLAGLRVVRAFGQETGATDALVGRSRRQLDANVTAVRIQSIYLTAMEFATVGSIAAVLAAGGSLAARDAVTVGTLSAFVLYLLLAFEPVQSLSFLVTMLESAAAALRKIYALLDEPVDLPEGTRELPDVGPLHAEDVGFRYGDGQPDVLRAVHLALAPGERVALVGPTGAGKSTLAKLMARLFDPTAGRVGYAGVDLRDVSRRALRSRVVMVAQDGQLTAGTLAHNLRAVRPAATDGELTGALAAVGAGDWLATLPDGLATQVGEGGSLLSAGERQLVALARVCLLDADVVVLDEATSGLDPGTEKLVEAAVAAATAGRTVLVVAHRTSTVRGADRVVVVDDGGVAEVGTHQELLARGGRYATIFTTFDGAPREAGGGLRR